MTTRSRPFSLKSWLPVISDTPLGARFRSDPLDPNGALPIGNGLESRNLVHCGLPKAGSTAIQDFLSLNASALRSYDYTLPYGGDRLAMPRLSSWFLEAESVGRRLIANPPGREKPVPLWQLRSRSAIEGLRWWRLAHNSRPQTLLWSSEQFSAIGSEQGISRFRMFFRLFAPETQGVLFLRSPEELFVSALLQKLTRGVGPRVCSPDPLASTVHFASLWRSHLDGRLALFRYRSPSQHHQGVVGLLSDYWFPSIPRNALQYPQVPRNRSLSVEAGILVAKFRSESHPVMPLEYRPVKVLALSRKLKEIEATRNAVSTPKLRKEVEACLIANSRSSVEQLELWMAQGSTQGQSWSGVGSEGSMPENYVPQGVNFVAWLQEVFEVDYGYMAWLRRQVEQ